MTPRHRRSPAIVPWLGALAIVAAACGGPSDGAGDGPGVDGGALDGEITVFAAASLTDALHDAAVDFEALHPGVTVEINTAGSSALREQILAGAPADVFAAAGSEAMDVVVEADATTGPARVLARNALEIVVPAGNPADVSGLADFGDPDLLIGLCAAQVPCGDLGREVLTRAGVEPAPDTDEPDVRSLLTKVRDGDLDAGLVYRTDVGAGGDAVEGIAIPDDDNVTVEYLVATLAGGDDPDVAAAFVDHLLSPAGERVLDAHGFAPA
jgi:molybdate transport system substrate-binding protein